MNRIGSLAAALALVGVLGKFYAVPAIAQAVRAAAVKSVDEKGRTPYFSRVQCQPVPATGVCYAIFPQVPSNKRLVVEYAAASDLAFSAVKDVILGQDAGSLLSGKAWARLPVHYQGQYSAAGNGYYVASEKVLIYYEEQVPPSITIVENNASFNGTAAATISGYLVDLNQ